MNEANNKKIWNPSDCKTTRDIFTKIYKENWWGGKEDEFNSGRGSHNNLVLQPYVDTLIDYLKEYRQNLPKIVDLGCGDFNVGKNFINYCSEYVGVDVVPELIEKLKKDNYPSFIKFLCADIVDDDLPDGDLCLIRQVFQHMSNEQIIKVLPKLKKYKVIFITEHYPEDNPQIVANKNILAGPGTRVGKNSAVYLDQPPFNISCHCLQLVLEVPSATGIGIIKTYKLEFPGFIEG